MKAPTGIWAALMVFLPCILSSAANQNVLGSVSLYNANYSLEVKDFSWGNGDDAVSFMRAYNSRSLFDGMFGFGWCSEFETTLTVQTDNSLLLTECGDGVKVKFLPRVETGRNVSSEWTNPVHGYVYRLNDNFVFVNEKGDRSEFAALGSATIGRILSRQVTKSCKFNFDYQYEILRGVRACGSKWLSINYSANGKVKQIQVAGKGLIQYQTSRLGDLLSVLGGELSPCRYQYSSSHNMTHVSQPLQLGQRPAEADLIYNEEQDWLTEFKFGSCEEDYEYVVEPRSTNRYTSRAKRLCQGELEQELQIQFIYSEKPGGTYLGASTLNENTFLRRNRIEFIGHPQFEDVLQSRTENGEKTIFEYGKDGTLLRTKTYDKTNKLIKQRSGQAYKKLGVDAPNCSWCIATHDPVTGKTGEL